MTDNNMASPSSSSSKKSYCSVKLFATYRDEQQADTPKKMKAEHVLNSKSNCPQEFLCPISGELMNDPVEMCSTGITYDRGNIQKWMDDGHIHCPVTKQPVTSHCKLASNVTLFAMIKDWQMQNKVVVDHDDDEEQQMRELEGLLNTDVSESTPKHLQRRLCEFRQQLKEEDKKTMSVDKRAVVNVMANVLAKFGRDASEEGIGLCEEVVRIIAFVPLDAIAKERVAQCKSMRAICRVLNQGLSIEGRNAAMQLISRLASEESLREDIGGTQRLIEGLLRLLALNVCHVTTLTLRKLCTHNKNKSRALNAGAIDVLRTLPSSSPNSSSSLLLLLQELEDPTSRDE